MSTAQALCDLFESQQSIGEKAKILREYIPDNNVAPVLSLMQYIALYCVKYTVGNVDLAQQILSLLESVVLSPFVGTVTLTFGDVAESHVGMQQIGQMADVGFSYEDLQGAKEYFDSKGCQTLLIHLNDFLPQFCEDQEENAYLEVAKTDPSYQAWVLVARDGLKCLTGDTEGKNLLTEMLLFKWDDQLWNPRKGQVQTKHARHNLNFAQVGQTADFQEGKGTTIGIDQVPLLKEVKSKLVAAFGEKAEELNVEGNLYHEVGKTGISNHGDSERRKVIGVRLGNRMSISWTWFYNNRPRGHNVEIELAPGDVYCMSEKTVGTDWRPNKDRGWKSKRYTLRHAAGAPYYLKTAPKPLKGDKVHIRNQRPYGDKIWIGDPWFKRDKKQSWDEHGKKSEC